MEQLGSSQREALEHLQGILGRQDCDVDVLINVLQTVDWNVQHATDLLMNEQDEGRDVDRNFRDRQAPQRSPIRWLFSLLYLPVGLVSGILRFVFGILRFPLLTSSFNFNFGTNYRVLRQTYPDSRSTIRRWITSLEEETGAVIFRSATAQTTGLDTTQSATRRHTYPPTSPADENKILPDFFDGTYEQVLDACLKEGKIACVILVSAEHDDVAEFKRSTLTHPGFVRMLSENNFIVWGGDVRDKDPWDAAQKLQATTYPFVAFIALQPRRNHLSSSSSPNPVLTVLSRHHGPSVPESRPTSPQTLMHHLEQQLLPRVSPFLTRYRSQLQERARDRTIREQQDRAFQESAERDRQRIQARIRAEQEEAERVRQEKVVRREEEHRMQLERDKQANLQALRLQYRRWMRRCIVPPEHRGENGIRLALKLPENTRVVRTFSPNSTLTELYAFVDTQLLPLTLQAESDPEHMLDGFDSDLRKLEKYIQSQGGDAESWWGFKLVHPYPKREIKWTNNVSLVDAGLNSGEQLVMEVTDGYTKSQHHSDDDYESEDD